MPASTKIWFARLGLTHFLAIAGGMIIFEPCALAQVASDKTLGSENSFVTPNININGVPSDKIDGGAIRGTNLFHSFQEFNIDEGRGVYFTNPSGIENILSRVTGNNPSNIFGKLGVLGNANLFLVNPNGIIFGANSSLDLRSSFVASTATALNFADGAKFSATPQSTPILTVSVPIGLGFERNTGGISVRGNGRGVETSPEDLANSDVGLQVQPDRTLALVGGDIAMVGATLNTSGGRIELGSVTSPSSVKLNPVAKGWRLEYTGISNFGDITLSDGTVVNASGAGGGDIQVVGRQIELNNASQIEASTLGAAPGGQVGVKASESIVLGGSGRGNEQIPTGILANIYPGAQGAGGNLTLDTKQLIVRDGAQIGSSVFGEGNASSILVKASDSIELAGQSAPNGKLLSGLFSVVAPEASGAGGSITVETKRLDIKDGAQVFAGTGGRGKAGSILIGAEEVELAGTGRTPNRGRTSSTIGTTALPGAIGSGGAVTVNTIRLTVRDGAAVSSNTLGKGKAGNILIQAAEAVDLVGRSTDGSLASNLSGRAKSSANAGNLTIEARQLNVRGGAQVSVRNDGTGNAGSLQVDADLLKLDNGGSITASTASGEGGNISLKTRNLQLRNGSNITASAGGSGNGGNITIDTGTLAALPNENSDITANAIRGRGGNISISTEGLFGTQLREQPTPFSDITASSQFGLNGIVNVRLLGLDPRNTLTPVTTAFLPTEKVMEKSCLTRQNSQRGRFVVTGGGALPATPDSGISEFPLLGELDATSEPTAQTKRSLATPDSTLVAATPNWKVGDPIVEAQRLAIASDGSPVLSVTPSQARTPNPQETICH